MSYVVVAEFRLKPDAIDTFTALMKRHAALSLAEPGCRLFEVCRDSADAALFLLYELYDDETAYVAHRATPHYQTFRSVAPEMLVMRDGELFQRRSVMARLT